DGKQTSLVPRRCRGYGPRLGREKAPCGGQPSAAVCCAGSTRFLRVEAARSGSGRHESLPSVPNSSRGGSSAVWLPPAAVRASLSPAFLARAPLGASPLRLEACLGFSGLAQLEPSFAQRRCGGGRLHPTLWHQAVMRPALRLRDGPSPHRKP